jgi:hypothetical protein
MIEPRERLVRSKLSLRIAQMSEALVSDARQWANNLVQREARGPGDTENAMRRVSQRYGVDYSALWALRYRPPKRVFADIYFALRHAYEAECERQLRQLEHELEITRAKAGPNHAAVRAAETLVGAAGDGSAHRQSPET